MQNICLHACRISKQQLAKPYSLGFMERISIKVEWGWSMYRLRTSIESP